MPQPPPLHLDNAAVVGEEAPPFWLEVPARRRHLQPAPDMQFDPDPVPCSI